MVSCFNMIRLSISLFKIRLSISLFKKSLLKGWGLHAGGVLEWWLAILFIVQVAIFIGMKAIHQEPP